MVKVPGAKIIGELNELPVVVKDLFDLAHNLDTNRIWDSAEGKAGDNAVDLGIGFSGFLIDDLPQLGGIALNHPQLGEALT